MDGSSEIPICDNEPIHIPGSIQPHGLLLVAARDGLLVAQGAGPIESVLGLSDWVGAPLAALLGSDLAIRIAALAAETAPETGRSHYIGRRRTKGGPLLDVTAHLARLAGAADHTHLIVELEPANSDSPSGLLLERIERATASFQQAESLDTLFQAAANAVRGLTGFDRALVYRFNDDNAGHVVAEDVAPGLTPLLNHHFPASDIPRQARALYVRNLVRVIPDIHYTPAPLRPAMPGAPVDMSDCSLRSVSPIHLQYVFNMGMAASASFSVVRDGRLWGLIACHNKTPRRIPYDQRSAGTTLVSIFAREIKAKEDAESYRQRLRLRSYEDDQVATLAGIALGADDGVQLPTVRHAMEADGLAVVCGPKLLTDGTCPPPAEIRALAAWVAGKPEPVRMTDCLPDQFAPAADYASIGAGLLSLVLSAEEPWVVLWFRAEQVETLRWAGNPHTKMTQDQHGRPSPRASFEEWSETVRNRSRRWPLAAAEAAERLHHALVDARQAQELADLNHKLGQLLHDKNQMLQQKAFLIGAVDHRLRNSLELVATFLAQQARAADSAAVQDALAEACRRLGAVGQVHRRLYRTSHDEVIDAARFIEELCLDTAETLGPGWRSGLVLDLAPVPLASARAMPVGLIVTELLMNTARHAYAGAPGPIEVRLKPDRSRFLLTIADRGAGPAAEALARGFGRRLMRTLAAELGASLTFEDNRPGLRAVLIAETAGPG